MKEFFLSTDKFREKKNIYIFFLKTSFRTFYKQKNKNGFSAPLFITILQIVAACMIGFLLFALLILYTCI